MSKHLILVSIFFLLSGCSKYIKTTNSQLEHTWEQLYSTKGCLTGFEHWHGIKKPRLSVFSEDQWQEFFYTAPEQIVPFLITKFNSEQSTNIHVCMFGNATEGELAVYATEYVLESNWFDCPASYKVLSDWSEKRINQATQYMIKDPVARKELINCLNSKYQ